MSELDLAALDERLVDLEEKEYWIHLDMSSGLDKYPAKQHARAAAEKLGVDSGLIYLAGAPTTYLEDSDQSAPFRQRRYFYYLSGSNEADNHLLYDIYTDQLTIYIPKIDLHKAVWGGAGSTKAEAEAKYDADEVAYVSELENAVKKWWKIADGKLYLLHPVHSVPSISASSPRVDSSTLRAAIDQCRVIKDEYEITLIRHANKVSANAHRAVLEKIRSFENESQVEGVFLDTCVSEGAHNQAYNIIAGSGSNASVLHYGKNDEPLAGRQVLLIDAGAEWNCYASDVTRTFPIAGHWTKEAKDIYDLVAKMQDTCISRIAPGIHYRDLQVLAHVIAAHGLLKLGIFHNGTAAEILRAGTTLAFFPHGLGHHVGLEVHDVLDVPIQLDSEEKRLQFAAMGVSGLTCQLFSTDLEGTSLWHPELYSKPDSTYATFNNPSICMSPARADSPTLKEGMVVTVEPGIYFSKFALDNHFLIDPVHAKFINKEILAKYMPVGGVRIEDDILVTRAGYENLTTAPKGENALKIIRGEEEDPELHHIPMSQAERLHREDRNYFLPLPGYAGLTFSNPTSAHFSEIHRKPERASALIGKSNSEDLPSHSWLPQINACPEHDRAARVKVHTKAEEKNKRGDRQEEESRKSGDRFGDIVHQIVMKMKIHDAQREQHAHKVSEGLGTQCRRGEMKHSDERGENRHFGDVEREGQKFLGPMKKEEVAVEGDVLPLSTDGGLMKGFPFGK